MVEGEDLEEEEEEVGSLSETKVAAYSGKFVNVGVWSMVSRG